MPADPVPVRPGTRRVLRPPGSQVSVPPRARGALPSGSSLGRTSPGSPPHVRGTRERVAVAPARQRLAPARRGTVARLVQAASRSGASRRLRGTHVLELHPMRLDRFTPPLVWGQTGRSASHVPSFRVYPRARGVQSVLTAFLTRTSVWSTPARAADRCRLVRPVEFTAPSELVGTQARSRRRCGLKA